MVQSWPWGSQRAGKKISSSFQYWDFLLGIISQKDVTFFNEGGSFLVGGVPYGRGGFLLLGPKDC